MGFLFHGKILLLIISCSKYLLPFGDVTVICKFLGFPGAMVVYRRGKFGQGSGFIWFSDLCCTGHESSPFHCLHNCLGKHNCRHHEDAGVMCTRKSPKWTLYMLCDLDQQSCNSVEGWHHMAWWCGMYWFWGKPACMTVSIMVLECTTAGILRMLVLLVSAIVNVHAHIRFHQQALLLQ